MSDFFHPRRAFLFAAFLALAGAPSLAQGDGDWPMWGHDESRRMSCDETGLPVDCYDEDEVRNRAEEVFRHVYRVYPTIPSPYYGTVAVA